MFDIATRAQPSTPANQGTVLGIPFDWRLAQPSAATSYPWTDYNSPTGVPQGFADVLATYALELEDTLQTVIVISLFTDARAGVDDVLPLNVTDRRGWVGDDFLTADAAETFDADNWGSLLWLYYIGKANVDVLEMARFAAKESLAWLVRDGIAERIVVTGQWVGTLGDRLALRPQIFKPGVVAPVYDVLWGTSVRRAVQ